MYGYAAQNPVMLVDPDGRSQTIWITNEIAGKTTVWPKTGRRGKSFEVPAYKAYLVHNETGYTKEFSVTRDPTAGRSEADTGKSSYDTNQEMPPGLHSVFIREKEKKDGSKYYVMQFYDPGLKQDKNNPGSVKNPKRPKKPRMYLQIHGVGCSKGCAMSPDAGEIANLSRVIQQSDKKSGVDSSIRIYVRDRHNTENND